MARINRGRTRPVFKVRNTTGGKAPRKPLAAKARKTIPSTLTLRSITK